MAVGRFSAAALFVLGAISGADAQSASAYSDPNTGIDFQAYKDDSGYQFGIALPETLGSDFIGQLVSHFEPVPRVYRY